MLNKKTTYLLTYCGDYLQKSTVDMWLFLINGRVQLGLRVTSGDVTLTSDPILMTSDTDDDEARCLFHVDVTVDRNDVTLTGKTSKSKHGYSSS